MTANILEARVLSISQIIFFVDRAIVDCGPDAPAQILINGEQQNSMFLVSPYSFIITDNESFAPGQPYEVIPPVDEFTFAGGIQFAPQSGVTT